MPRPFAQARHIIHHVHGCAGMGAKGHRMTNAKATAIFLSAVVLTVPANVQGQGLPSSGGEQNMRVVLLGTQGGPTFNAQRLGISTLVLAGSERLVFDAGRVMIRDGKGGARTVPTSRKCFLTRSLHSHHVISLPGNSLISPWASQGRQARLEVRARVEPARRLQVSGGIGVSDIHVRRDVRL